MRQHKAGDGLCAAAKKAPHGMDEVLRDFRKLNTREARAAFADHWIGLWARDFDEAWPMLYELLKIVDEDQLYKDPRRVGPRAPGSSHGPQSSYPDFAAYFADRVRRPFEHWAELEATYQYAQRYAPDALKLLYPEAKDEALREGPGRPLKAVGAPRTSSNNPGITRIKCLGDRKDAAYIRARLKRDGKTELLAKIERGEISVHAAAVEAGFRRRLVQVEPTVEGFARAIAKHLSVAERRALSTASPGGRFGPRREERTMSTSQPQVAARPEEQIGLSGLVVTGACLLRDLACRRTGMLFSEIALGIAFA